ncbi:electron carrier [Recurvomyces mirabilis]|uniref:Electron carrier n=1 Tax=Recurvomyces mirabilis TaxID=574656 RepID=A0AAE0TQX8_9PEZI|nr:electron carrier [Recurvomyces mirabilis]KAK5156507.1 electron carrier [Recurvomyces mirabilis]
MAPAVMIDNTPDFEMPSAPAPTKSVSGQRTLLLAPPSVSSHPQALTNVAAAYDRSATDIQMLDRLAMGLVALPTATYDVVLLLTDVDGSRSESSRLLDRQAMQKLVESMKPGGRLRSQDGSFGGANASEQTEAILAGLAAGGGDGMVKPESGGGAQTVTLSFGKKKKANAAAVPLNATEASVTAKRKSEDISSGSASLVQGNGSVVRSTPAGVGFVDANDDFDGGFDDGNGYDEDDDMEIPDDAELEAAGQIDPDTLLTEEDRMKPIIIPDACKPNTKRRRACKDCTCGLAERLDAEDKTKRVNADSNLAKLSATDLNEVDFTVKGKVGSCGNCALGDAFRCDGCPYIGLPAFKPGEEVRLLNNDVQL